WNVLFLPLPVCLCLIMPPAWAIDLPENAPVPTARDEGAAAAAKKAEPLEEKEELPQEAPVPEKRPKQNPADSAPAKANEAGNQSPAGVPEDEPEVRAPAAKQAEPKEEEESKPGEDDDSETQKSAEPDIPPPLSPAGKL